MVKQYFVPDSVWSQVIEVDADEDQPVKPATGGTYHAIAGVLAAGTLTVANTFDRAASVAATSTVAASGSVPASYAANFVDFDGVNDVVQSFNDAFATTGTKKATLSFNLYVPVMPSGTLPILAMRNITSERLAIDLFANGRFGINFEDTSGGGVVNLSIAPGLFTDDTAYNIQLSFDTTTGVNTYHYYINGVVANTDVNTLTTDAVVSDMTRLSMGDNNAGSPADQMYLADFYLNFGEYMDLSQSANRAKLAATADKGSDGSNPTGSQPEIFFSGDESVWSANKGSLGDIFTEDGDLTNAPSPPN